MNYVMTVAAKPNKIIQNIILSVFILMMYNDDTLIGRAAKFTNHFPTGSFHDVPI